MLKNLSQNDVLVAPTILLFSTENTRERICNSTNLFVRKRCMHSFKIPEFKFLNRYQLKMNNIFQLIQTGHKRSSVKCFIPTTIQFLSAESRFIPRDFRIKMDLVTGIVLFCFQRAALLCLQNPADFLCLDDDMQRKRCYCQTGATKLIHFRRGNKRLCQNTPLLRDLHA